MAKSEHENNENICKRQERIDIARKFTREAIRLEKNGDLDQVGIDALWGSSTKNFFYALVLGHLEAPRCLALAFDEGTGVKEDKHMAALFYGIALELKDPKCVSDEDKPFIPKFLKPAICAIAKLVIETHAQIPASGVDADKFIQQMDIFEDAIASSSGRLISTFFTHEDVSQQSISEHQSENPGWVHRNAEYCKHQMDEAIRQEGVGAEVLGAAASHP